jgi:hypothetical protein
LWSIFNIVRCKRSFIFYLNFLTLWTLINILGPLDISKLPNWCLLERGLTNIYLSKAKGYP